MPSAKARHQFQGRGIDPLGVFDDEQHRMGLAGRDDLVDEEGESCRLPLRRRQQQRQRRRVRDRQ